MPEIRDHSPFDAAGDAGVTRAPFPNSKKIYVEGSDPAIRVPMREVSLSDTVEHGPGGEQRTRTNPPVALYDTSGPYTDTEAPIDLRGGLAPVRAGWIEGRKDTEVLGAGNSSYAREEAAGDESNAARFPASRPPRRAISGRRVTQMHYARRGEITPEMEFVAIRENMRCEQARRICGSIIGAGKRAWIGRS